MERSQRLLDSFGKFKVELLGLIFFHEASPSSSRHFTQSGQQIKAVTRSGAEYCKQSGAAEAVQRSMAGNPPPRFILFSYCAAHRTNGTSLNVAR